MNEPSSLPAIETLLPHQAPMLLLDRLCAVDASRACCETRVGARHALLLDGEGNLPGWVGIECRSISTAPPNSARAESSSAATRSCQGRWMAARRRSRAERECSPASAAR